MDGTETNVSGLSDADRLVVEKLREVGVSCGSIYDLVSGVTPPAAIPMLLHLLDVVQEPVIVEGVVRALRTKAARGIAEERLIALFRRLQSGPADGLKWAIGNTLEGLDRKAFAKEYLALAMDKRHGMGRQMIVEALGWVAGAPVTQALIALLADDDVNGHAIGALRRRHAREAIPALMDFEAHPNTWKRRSAAQAIAAISKFHAMRH